MDEMSERGMSERGWTFGEIADLRRLFGSNTNEDLVPMFGRPVEEIAAKADELALAKSQSKFNGQKMPRWTLEEVATLRELYPDVDNLTIARRLGKSRSSIVSKAHSMQLHKTKEHVRAMGNRNRQIRRARAQARGLDSDAP